LVKIKVQLSNQLDALLLVPTDLNLIVDSVKAHFQSIKKSIKELENELSLLISTSYLKTYTNLKSIAGVGDRIATAFVAYFGTFETFGNCKQVISFLGTNPGTFESGTSVKRPGAISKRGNRYLRKILYMGAMSASKSNPSCIQMSKRMKAKGKKGKVILIAIANKLVRQMFAIAKSNVAFDPNFNIELFKSA
jgi:transposase